MVDVNPAELIKRLIKQDKCYAAEEMAKMLGLDIVSFDMLLRGHLPISTDIAYRLSAVLGGTPENWVYRQLEHDIAQQRRKAYRSRELFK